MNNTTTNQTISFGTLSTSNLTISAVDLRTNTADALPRRVVRWWCPPVTAQPPRPSPEYSPGDLTLTAAGGLAATTARLDCRIQQRDRRINNTGRTEVGRGCNAKAATLGSNVACQWRSKKGPPRRCKKGPLGGCGLVPVVHGRAPRATRRALNRLTRRRTREGPVGPRGQAWAGWSVQLAVGV